MRGRGLLNVFNNQGRVALPGAQQWYQSANQGWGWAPSLLVASGVGAGVAMSPVLAEDEVDLAAIKADLEAFMENPQYEDGSYGPLFIRLAWHAAGSYSAEDDTGGSNGATMRFAPESEHGGNAGLHIARDLLAQVGAKYPSISTADLWSFAGTVAIEALGGPKVTKKWRGGRADWVEESVKPTPDGRLPDATQRAQHLRDVFYRMGFSDRDIVALSGAHALGRCHRDRSGFEGPWTKSPTFFSNDYFIQLVENTWTETTKYAGGPSQYQDPTGELMMLPSDMALTEDADFRHWVGVYAEDEELWFQDFSRAWTKLQELGVKRRGKSFFEKLF